MAAIPHRAERRGGELLAEMPKQRGGRPIETGSIVEPVSSSLADIGIDKKQSHRWQRMAGIPYRAGRRQSAAIPKTLSEHAPVSSRAFLSPYPAKWGQGGDNRSTTKKGPTNFRR